MAYSSPRTWVAGETVTAALLNTHLKDQLLHIAGTAGFTGSMSATVGVQPASGYFCGAAEAAFHVEGGSTNCAAAGNATVTFASQFAAAPVVMVQSIGTYLDYVLGVTTTANFTVGAAGESTGIIFHWIAAGV